MKFFLMTALFLFLCVGGACAQDGMEAQTDGNEYILIARNVEKFVNEYCENTLARNSLAEYTCLAKTQSFLKGFKVRIEKDYRYFIVTLFEESQTLSLTTILSAPLILYEETPVIFNGPKEVIMAKMHEVVALLPDKEEG